MAFYQRFADSVLANAESLCRTWLDRLRDLLPVEARDIFPTQALLDHVPSILRGLAADLAAAEDDLLANNAVSEKARELGRLRFAQDASVHQILREYDLLASILGDFLRDALRDESRPPPSDDVLLASERIHRAIRLLGQASVDAFSEIYTATIERQKAQLENFNRLVAHELRNPVHSLEITVSLLEEERLTPENADRVIDIVRRNVDRITHLLKSLETIARVEDDTHGPTTQPSDLHALMRHLVEELSEMATAYNVEIRVASDLGQVLCDPHRIEMMLVNLLSNAIKYSDPAKSERWVSIETLRGDPQEGSFIELRVRDNGIGIPLEKQDAVFERFVRAHPEFDAEHTIHGSGLGLAIVRECARRLGGTVRLQSAEGTGTEVTVALPATDGSS